MTGVLLHLSRDGGGISVGSLSLDISRRNALLEQLLRSWWTFRIFSIFFCSRARERGASEEVAGAPVFYIENRGRGGGFRGGGAGGGRAPGECPWGGGVGLNIPSGAKMPTKLEVASEPPELLRSCSRCLPCCAYGSSLGLSGKKKGAQT